MNRLLIRMDHASDRFSKGQRRIAAFIREHYDKAAYMTACKLGETVGVSESTVVRFATELGYEGYPQLQKAMQEMIRNRLTAVQRMEITCDRIAAEDDLVSKVMHIDMDSLRRTIEEVDRRAFARSVDLILSAKRIFVMGARSSYSLAAFLTFYFHQIFDNVKQVEASNAAAAMEQLARIGREDVLIAITVSRYATRTYEASVFAKEQGAGLIAITDSVFSPVAELADAALAARTDMASFAHSLVAPLSLINALFVAIAMKREKEVAASYAQLESIWEEYGVYEKDIDVR